MGTKRGSVATLIVMVLTLSILMGTLSVYAANTWSQDRLYREIEAKGFKREIPAVDYTDEAIEEISKLLPKRFSDIDGSEWYIKDLALLTSKGIVNGVGDGTKFAGTNTVTRSEFWAMQGRLQGIGTKLSKDIMKDISSILEDSRLDNVDDLVNSWYLPYYYGQKGIPFGLYTHEDMLKPIYRGEVALLIFQYLAKGESTDREIGEIADKTYFKDIPNKLTSLNASENGSKLHKEQMEELGIQTGYYYPKFNDVVDGRIDMLERTKIAINWCNAVGIMCGLPDKTSGWNKELTRGEAVATLARAFRYANRLPEEKRVK